MRLFASFKAIEIYVIAVGALCLFAIDRLCELQEITLDNANSITHGPYEALQSIDLFVKDRRKQADSNETTTAVPVTASATTATALNTTTSSEATVSTSKATTTAPPTTSTEEVVTSTVPPATTSEALTTTKAPETTTVPSTTALPSTSTPAPEPEPTVTPSLGPGTPLGTDGTEAPIEATTKEAEKSGGLWGTLTNIFDKRRKRQATENVLVRQNELDQQPQVPENDQHQHEHGHGHEHEHQHQHDQQKTNAEQYQVLEYEQHEPKHQHHEHEHQQHQHHEHDHVQKPEIAAPVTLAVSPASPIVKNIPVIDEKYTNKTAIGVYRCEITDEFFLDAFLFRPHVPIYQRIAALRYWAIILLGFHLLSVLYHGCLNVQHRVPTSRRANTMFTYFGILIWSVIMGVIISISCQWSKIFANEPITPEFPFLLYTFSMIYTLMMALSILQLVSPSMFWWSFDVLPRSPRLGYMPAAQSENAYINGIIRKLETTDAMEVQVDTTKPIIRPYE